MQMTQLLTNFFCCFQIGKKLKAQLPLLENRHIFRNIKNTKRLN